MGAGCQTPDLDGQNWSLAAVTQKMIFLNTLQPIPTGRSSTLATARE